MMQRKITRMTVDVWHENSGFVVQVKTTYVESTIGGGRLKSNTDRYKDLAIEEARDVLDAVSNGALPTDDFGVQMVMFDLV